MHLSTQLNGLDFNRLTEPFRQLLEDFGDAPQKNDEDGAPLVRAPQYQIERDDEAVVLVVELPGVAEGALDLELETGVLSLSARAAHRPLEYRQRFRLSETIDTEAIEARLTDGVLRLSLPKAKAALPRKISLSPAE